MCFIGVCVTECLNKPLCVQWESLRRKSLVTFAVCLLYLIHFQWQKKRPIQRPGMGRESPFHTRLVGKVSSILCMPFAYDPFFSQRSPWGRNPWNVCRIHQIPLSHSPWALKGLHRSTLFNIFVLEMYAYVCVTLACVNVNANASLRHFCPVYSKVAMCVTQCAIFNVRA